MFGSLRLWDAHCTQVCAFARNDALGLDCAYALFHRL